MAPKSSDCEVKDGSLSDPQLTDPMGTFTGTDISFLGKRKAETPNPEDSGESDGDDYEGVEDGDGDEDTEPEWGYDSSDDRKYDAADQNETKCERFCYRFSGVAYLTDLEEDSGDGLTIREFCSELTSLCLERYNQLKGSNVKLEHILRANFDPGSMCKYYITFAARESESPNAPLVEYQAKAAWSVGNKTYPIFCRPTPPPKMIN